MRWPLLVFFSLSLALGQTPSRAAKAPLVLVHGALLTGGAWKHVGTLLESQGYSVATPDVAGRNGDGFDPRMVTLSLAAQRLCAVVRLQGEPVILVGHSQGGAVITEALGACSNSIKALVYVAAVVPLPGEAVFQDLDSTDNRNFDQCASIDPEAGIFRINEQGPLRDLFMADVPEPLATSALSAMVPEPVELGNGVLSYARAEFDSKAKFYVETTEDRIISLSTQKRIQSKVRFDGVYTLASSHSPFLSQPGTLATILATIERSVGLAQPSPLLKDSRMRR